MCARFFATYEDLRVHQQQHCRQHATSVEANNHQQVGTICLDLTTTKGASNVEGDDVKDAGEPHQQERFDKSKGLEDEDESNNNNNVIIRQQSTIKVKLGFSIADILKR